MATNRRWALTCAVLLAAALAASCAPSEAPAVVSGGFRIEVNLPEGLSREPVDGRLLLMISDSDKAEPRFQIGDDVGTQQVFGLDVNGMKPGEPVLFDAKVYGYPLESLAQIPAGTYYVQALLHRYETFTRADGKVVKLPMDRGEGQQWNRAPGNLLSAPKKIVVDPHRGGLVQVALEKAIPPIPDPPETKYIKHLKIQSALLTKFWGRPMYLAAHVLLPAGFDTHPDARYPLVIDHGHFPFTFQGFREEPPDPNLAPEYSERFNWPGYNRTQQELEHQFYKDWIGRAFPRFLLVQIQHANPYYDDSYAVNSENLGPYGDAIVRELIPAIEQQYRGLGAGWARFMYGGSTGGWEALGAQVFYPDEFNGCFAACPDPIDFRQYTVVDLYKDKNAYYVEGRWKKIARPGHRNYLGHIQTTIADMNHLEAVLGTRGRSGGQWDIWQAVYSPVGADGYPKPIFNKMTGVIDPTVAEYLEGALRPVVHHAPRLGEGSRRQAQGQGPHLRRRHGQLLPEQRRLPGRGVPERDDEPALRGRGGLRRPGRALLERRPHPAQRDWAPPLRADVRAEDRGAHPEVRTEGGGSQELEVLATCLSECLHRFPRRAALRQRAG